MANLTADIRVILFLLQHDLPFSLAEPLFKLIKSMPPEELVMEEIECEKTKATETTTGEKVAEVLRTTQTNGWF